MIVIVPIGEWTSMSDGLLWFKVTGQLIGFPSVSVTTHKRK